MVAGKVVSAMAFALPSIVLVGVAAALTQDVRLGFDRWLGLTLVLWLAATAAGVVLALWTLALSLLAALAWRRRAGAR